MKPTLIIVDDLKEIRAELRAILEEEYSILEEVGDAISAVEAFRRHAPDLMVMDIVMPGMSGIDAVRSIRASPGPHPKIVMLSGLTDEKIVREALEAGASDYLFKPVVDKKLREVLRDFCAPVVTE